MKDKTYELLIKSWEMNQSLAKGFGDSCWKIKSIGIGFWSTILGYSYKQSDILPLWFAVLIIFLFFTLETGLKRLQYKYIYKSLEVEESLNDILVGDDPRLPDTGISTNIEIPKLNDFIELFRLKRWMFWMPYLVMFIFNIIIIVYFSIIM